LELDTKLSPSFLLVFLYFLIFKKRQVEDGLPTDKNQYDKHPNQFLSFSSSYNRLAKLALKNIGFPLGKQKK